MGRAKDTCPYCNKRNCVGPVAFENVMTYDDDEFHMPCLHCGKMIYVRLIRTVVIDGAVVKSDRSRSESDF